MSENVTLEAAFERIERLEAEVARLTEENVSIRKVVQPDSISLISEDKRHSIAMVANNSTAGIWLENKKDDVMIAIYTTNGQSCVGFYGSGAKRAINIGFGVTADTN